MRMPRITGEIERRILVNYRLDPQVAQAALPKPFRPALHEGYAIAGICLIRMGSLRPDLPTWVPQALQSRVPSLRTENAAHRFADEWDDPQLGPAPLGTAPLGTAPLGTAPLGTAPLGTAPLGTRTGVWIPRRDTDSAMTVALGGRFFPGAHHAARFDVHESETELHVAFEARDGSGKVSVDVAIEPTFGSSEVFSSLEQASAFFEQGSVGWSATHRGDRHDGLRLNTSAWNVEPARVLRAESSFFEDPEHFPPGTAEVDNALVMRRIPVTWESLASLRAA